jgi:hypothetical protein
MAAVAEVGRELGASRVERPANRPSNKIVCRCHESFIFEERFIEDFQGVYPGVI